MLNSVRVAINLFGKGAATHMIGSDEEEQGFCPERRLWCAVIISSVDEYREWLQRIHVGWTTSQRPIEASYKFSLKHIRHQCNTEWFHLICEMADISPEVVLRKFDELDREYCLNQIPFQDEPDRFISQWALRKISKQKIAN